MNTRSTAGIVGLGLLLCSYVTAVAAECGFGALCDKTISMLFLPVRACYNGSCSDSAPLHPVSSAYFASDGTVLTHFGDWWDIPGVDYDTFVCRSDLIKSVSRSCYGAGCRPDIVQSLLKSVHMTDSCSVAGSEDNLTITLLKKVRRSKNKSSESPSLFTDLRIQINVKGMKEEQSDEYKCDANIHASARFYPTPTPKLRYAVTELNYEFDGAVKTAKVSGLCGIDDGNRLIDTGDKPGKVIDAGP
jgi:hypothetical protein